MNGIDSGFEQLRFLEALELLVLMVGRCQNAERLVQHFGVNFDLLIRVEEVFVEVRLFIRMVVCVCIDPVLAYDS